MEFIILSSLLLGTSIGNILAKFLTEGNFFHLFNTNIPGMSSDLIKYKTFDLTEFVLTIISTFTIFAINYFITKRNQISTKNEWSKKTVDLIYLTFTFIVFLQSLFVSNSGKITLVIIVLGQIAYLFINRIKIDKPKDHLLLLANGLLAGFYTMIVTQNLTTSTAIPLICLFITPLIYLLFGYKFLKSPSHLIFSFIIINPLNLFFSFLIGFMFVIFTLLTYKRALNNRVIKIYPLILISIFSFSHLYYSGRFDSIEEGFWLGWLQGLTENKYLYKDIAVYHPPLIVWGLFAFTSATEYSIKNLRLYMHLLEILGILFYYISIDKLIKNNLLKFIAILTALSTTETLVRNNVEIRLGVGLFAIAVLYHYWKTNNKKWLMIAGIVSSISFFVSLEVGIATMLSSIFAIILFENFGKIKSISRYFVGLAITTLPILTYLYFTKSLIPFLHQTSFYAMSFSNGYFNDPVERAITTSFLHWHLVWQYFSSEAWYWEFSRMVILAVILTFGIYIIKGFETTKKVRVPQLKSSEKLALTLSFMGIILFRSSLGRSDYHHLLFVLLIAIQLFFYLLEKHLSKSKLLFTTITIIFTFVFFVKNTQELYVSKRLFELTTYGKFEGEYQTYDNNRSGIIFGKEVNVAEMDGVIKYLSDNVSENETIYIFPWNPEVYFLANKSNASSNYTPYSFWSDDYQKLTISELESTKPKFVITNEGSQFANMSMESLPVIKSYIDNNFTKVAQIHSFKILAPNNQ